MRSLHQALVADRIDDDTFRLVVDDGWQQGRGAFGGLLVGALVRTASVVTADPARRVRSVTAELLGPVLPGDATLKVERLRRGSGVSGVRVRLLQAEAPGRPLDELCQAVVVFAKDRPDAPVWNHVSPPSIPDWRTVPETPLSPPLAPVFTQHFEFRITGAWPFSSAGRATAQGFVRPQVRGPVDDAVVAACADAWWPAAFAMFAAPRPMATITYTLELHDTALRADEPLFHDAVCDVAGAGYATEHRRLWSPDGRLVAQNQQVFAVIR
jgi:acyl-CoA thioesterase